MVHNCRTRKACFCSFYFITRIYINVCFQYQISKCFQYQNSVKTSWISLCNTKLMSNLESAYFETNIDLKRNQCFLFWSCLLIPCNIGIGSQSKTTPTGKTESFIVVNCFASCCFVSSVLVQLQYLHIIGWPHTYALQYYY